MEKERIFHLPDQRKVVYPLTEGNWWEQKEFEAPIFLTQKERLQAEVLNYDLKNVLIVKQGLVKKLKPSQIVKKYNVSRTCVYKYKKLFSEKDIKNLQKDSKNTVNLKSVFPIWLIPIFLDAENTNPYPGALLLLFFIFVFIWLTSFWSKEKQKRSIHLDDSKFLKDSFSFVFDLTYNQTPILCDSKKEADHFRKLCTHYNNANRCITFIEREMGQSRSEHRFAKDDYSAAYCSNNFNRVREGKERSLEEWQKLEDLGLLDFYYLSRKDSPTFEVSRKYLLDSVEFYLDNQDIPTEDKAKIKKLYEFIPEELKTKKHAIN